MRLHGGAQDFARRDPRQTVTFTDSGGLRPLTGTRWSDEDDVDRVPHVGDILQVLFGVPQAGIPNKPIQCATMTCPNCSAQMTERTLEGHLGTKVTIDSCEGCQAFWFDGRESLQLSPGATLELFQTIGEQAAQARQPSADVLKCPRCDARMKIVSDLQRSTRFQYRQCPQRHGRFITYFDFLREKNFIRPLSRQQIDDLRQHLKAVNCSNCGASVELAKGSMCAHCGSALSMLDMKQASALVQQLKDADRGAQGQVDPALPMNLSRAKRDAESAFAAFERDQSWLDDVSSVGLVQAGLTAVNRWMKRAH